MSAMNGRGKGVLPMSEDDLKRLVQELSAELEAVEHQAGDKERLQALHDGLEQRLEHPREDNQDEELIDAITEGIAHFEVEHPRATALLNQILQTLGNLGI